MKLAARALADLGRLPGHRVAMTLKATAATAKHPVACVAEVMGVAAETVWRWAVGKAAVLSWLAEGRNAKGDAAHWTLEGLRLAIAEEYAITLGTATIWSWLRKEGWRQKTPRPRRCKADGQAFKKTEGQGRRCLLVMDRGGWHTAKGIVAPPDMEIAFLPPCLPELNPQEQVWGDLKEKFFGNRFFKSIEEAVDTAVEALRSLESMPDVLARLLGGHGCIMLFDCKLV